MSEASRIQPAAVAVPASTSNLGAGFDCIGLALDRYLEASFEPGGAALELTRQGTLAALRVPAENDVLVRAFRARFGQHGADAPAGRLTMRSEIPLARGLGSSAAAAVAGIALADAAAGRRSAAGPGARAPRGEWLELAAALEGHADNAAPALFGGLVAVARDAAGRPRAFPLPLSERLCFVFAAPGVEVSTPAARAALPADVPHAVAVRALGRVAALLHGLATADAELLALGFADELHVPYRLPLIPGAARAFDAARQAGAWAATISGSGSGLIAACAPEHAEAVAAAMAEALRAEAGPDGVVAFVASPDHAGVRPGGAPWR